MAPPINAKIYNRSVALTGGASFHVNENEVVTPQGALTSKTTVSTVSTAAAVTYTPAQVIGGLILRDPNGAGRSDVTPTAAQMVQYLKNCSVGQTIVLIIRNTADAAETITMTAGTGVTLSGTMTIAQNNTKEFLMVLTNVKPGSEAATLYSVGTFVH